MDYYMILNNPTLASFVFKQGVNRVFLDLEYFGKAERQSGLNTWKSHHSVEDITHIKEVDTNVHLMVRVNPLYSASDSEIDEVIDRGADSIMIPMFRTTDELGAFYEYVAGRVQIVPLVETVSAVNIIQDFLYRLPVSRLHIGLNDLSIDAGMDFLFEPILKGMLDEPCRILREANCFFGIGGTARSGEGLLSPEILLGEYYRLGSQAVILSRTFHRECSNTNDLAELMDFREEIEKLNKIIRNFSEMPSNELVKNKIYIRKLIQNIISDKNKLDVAPNSK